MPMRAPGETEQGELTSLPVFVCSVTATNTVLLLHYLCRWHVELGRDGMGVHSHFQAGRLRRLRHEKLPHAQLERVRSDHGVARGLHLHLSLAKRNSAAGLLHGLDRTLLLHLHGMNRSRLLHLRLLLTPSSGHAAASERLLKPLLRLLRLLHLLRCDVQLLLEGRGHRVDGLRLCHLLRWQLMLLLPAWLSQKACVLLWLLLLLRILLRRAGHGHSSCHLLLKLRLLLLRRGMLPLIPRAARHAGRVLHLRADNGWTGKNTAGSQLTAATMLLIEIVT